MTISLLAEPSSPANIWERNAIIGAVAALGLLLAWNHYLRKKPKPNVFQEAVSEILKGVLVVFFVTILFELAHFREIVVAELNNIVSVRDHLKEPAFLHKSFSDESQGDIVKAIYEAQAMGADRPLLDGESETYKAMFFESACSVARGGLSITRSQKLAHGPKGDAYLEVDEHSTVRYLATPQQTRIPAPPLGAWIRTIPDIAPAYQYGIKVFAVDGIQQDVARLEIEVDSKDGYSVFSVTNATPSASVLATAKEHTYACVTSKLVPYEDSWIGRIVAPTTDIEIELEYEPELFERPRLDIISSSQGIKPVAPVDTGIKNTVTWQHDGILFPNDGWIVTWRLKPQPVESPPR